MESESKEVLLIGVLAVAVGVSGWLLPYRYNLLRLKRLVSGFLSEEANRRVPKIVGSILIVVGLVLIVGALAGWTAA